MKGLREMVSAFFKTWGLSDAPAPAGGNLLGVDVVLDVGDADPLVVGTLSSEEGEYTFRYSEAFKQRPEMPPIGPFPDRDRVYRSRELWAFFQVRLPPFDRPDVKAVLEAKHLDRNDLLALLADLGGRAVTSPYDLVRHRRAAA